MKRLILWALLAVGVFWLATRGHAQVLPSKVDTLVMDVPGAEQRLVSKSLILLAARYQVNIAESEVTQARAWYNPNIVYTQSLYDPESGTWLDNSPASGQVDVQVNQLFSIAGKHINEVRLARIEVERSKYAFDELALSLKYDMYSDIAALYNAQQTDKLLDVEISELDKLIFAEKKELSLGAAAGNEVIRLEAEKQSTIADKLANLSALADLESQLRVLLGFGANDFLSFPLLPAPASTPPSLDSLLSLSASRPDVMLANTDVEWNSRNLALQHSQSVPDVVVGTEYDRRSSYVNNLWTVHAGIDIPIFNRNQGNIKAAQFALTQSQFNDSLALQQARSEVMAAYVRYTITRNARDSIYAQPGIISGKQNGPQGSYLEDLQLMFTNATENYSNRRISLIEFLDQLRTYDDARRNLFQLDSNFFMAAQELNYSTGAMIIK